LQFKGLYNMPVTVTTVSTRPNSTVEFWTFNEETRAHLTAEFRDTGKLTSRTDSISEDSLTKTVVRTFADPAALDAYRIDALRTAASESQREYNTLHGHTTTATIAVV
jgi:hypothetical protein